MSRLPVELVENICRHLDMYGLTQCLSVNRAWNGVAHAQMHIVNNTNTVNFHGYRDIRWLSTRIARDPEHGHHIKRMRFIMLTGTGSPVTQNEFLAILRGCPNLAELIFVNVNPIYYLLYMLRALIDLPHLEFVHVTSKITLFGLGQNFMDVAHLYHTTINRLDIHIGYHISRFMALNNVAQYFHPFTSLKQLHLDCVLPVVFDNLLRACPQLQELKLQVDSDKFIVEEEINRQDYPDFKLETLIMYSRLVNQDLYLYLSSHYHYLSELCLFGTCPDLGPIGIAFNGFSNEQTLPLTQIAFGRDFPLTEYMASHIGTYFSLVRQVKLKQADVSSITDEHRNTLLNFKGMVLDYFSMDISPLFSGRRSGLARVVLELVTHNNDTTTWYQRDGKWKTRHLFILKDRKSYSSNTIRQKRVDSNKTAVITVKAASIKVIQVYFHCHSAKFDQVIHLDA